ncbi:MAG: glycosyltransferase family 2 protein [Spirochaetes bacterium]|nr:glycosyltransferase family 2 protein [Spirochaetota bacterium]
MTIKVSVIVPVYNTEKYLSQCIESILNQTLTDLELIIVNDGSSDGSLKIIEKYKNIDDRIVLINNDKPSGNPGTPRNQALRVARGHYIGFVDSDDWVESENFELLYNKGLENNSQIVLMRGFYKNFDGKTQTFASSIGQHEIYNKEQLFAKYSSNAIWDKLFKKDFLDLYELQLAETKIGVDIPFVISGILLAERISIVDGITYHYRQNVENSTLHKRESGNYSFLKHVYDITESILVKYDILNNYKNIITYKRINSMFYLASQITNKSKKFHFYKSMKKQFRLINDKEFTLFLEKIRKIELKKNYISLKKYPLWLKILFHNTKRN